MFRVTRFFYQGYVPVILPALFLAFCHSHQPAAETGQPPGKIMGYDMEAPSATYALDNPDLREISALSPTGQKDVYATIADEKGVVYFLDMAHEGAVVKLIPFRDKGDFEGIELVGNTIWALKSDGKLFEINHWDGAPEAVQVQEYSTFLQKENNLEGLCYDPKREALLLACKEQPDSMYLRHVFAFDLKTRQLNAAPVYAIDPNEVNRLVAYGDTEKHDAFSPSAIAIHPKTGDVYVISTALKRLIVLDYQTGKIKAAVRLDKKLMPQPEGITFDTEGNLILCSEGKKGDGLLFRFDYHPN